MHQRYDVAFFSLKSRRSQFKKVQRSEKDGKSQRDREGHWVGKINLVVRKNSSFEISIYHYIIYGY